MEQALALRAPIAARDQFVSVDGDALWQAYSDYAVALANELMCRLAAASTTSGSEARAGAMRLSPSLPVSRKSEERE